MNIVKPNDRTTLLLNKSWMPINITTARAACRHMLTGRVGILDRFGNVHHIEQGGATAHNLEGFTWLDGRENLETGLDLSNLHFHEEQPVLRSANGVWPIPTIALTEASFFKKMRRGKPSIQILARLYKNTCQICLKKFPTSQLTIDHVFPKSKGGPLDDWNVLPVCAECNRMKSDITPYSDVNGTRLDNKIKKMPHLFLPHVADIREEWGHFLFKK